MQPDRPMSTADLAHARGPEPAAPHIEPDRPAPTGDVVPRHDLDPARAAPVSAPPDSAASRLFPAQDAGRFRERWTDIQTGFVDEPRRAVEQADGLVAEIMQRLAQGFADERSGLERQWDRGDRVSTEDLRVALQRYRAFFDRLLAI